jgi:uncharacterized membrane protein
MIFLDVVTTVCIGLLIGTEFSVSAFINPILQRLDAGSGMRATSLFAKRLGTAMPFWYAASLALLIADASLRRHGSLSPLLIAAGVLWLAAILMSVIFLVPINNRIIRLEAGSSADSLREQRRWELLHRGRVGLLTASMVCFLTVILG